MKKFQQFRQSFIGRLLIFSFAFLVIIGVFYWVVADDWTMTAVETDTVSQSVLLPADSVVEQQFTSAMDGIEEITLIPHFDLNERAGSISFALYDGQEALWQHTIDAMDMVSDQKNTIPVEPYLPHMDNQSLRLVIDPQGTGLALWAGSAVNTGRYDVAVQTSGLSVNGEPADGCLVLNVRGHRLLGAAKLIWPVGIALLLVVVGLSVLCHVEMKKGHDTLLTRVVRVYRQYRYLIKQLVSRDFRVKYKSSLLGMAWSFLNPLLTMSVYLFVFSTLFHSDIEYFPIYLMAGIIIFSCFSESTTLGLGSIVGNSALITKVYMPKMIYPLSKVLSSFINFCISLIPLLLVMIVTGVPFCKSLLLMPIVIGFLLMLSLGVSLILSTMNVFFRDTQFLWSVVVVLLNFLSPIFYPESIIPAEYLMIYRMNPIYQILFFARSIIIHGVSPTPASYLYCLLASVIPLLIGIWVFRKNQDRFVLYL